MTNEKTGTEKRASNRDYSISCARLIAMCFIVACHIMQRDSFASDINGVHIEWAYWFNVGVQMFLFISGYLYGVKKKIVNVEFYKKSFPKILIDYYIFIIVMLALIHWSPIMSIDEKGIKALLTFSGTVPGLGHLWFIPAILFCYLFTPAFSGIINSIDVRSNLRFVIESTLMLIIIHETVTLFFGNFSPAWTNCFVLGMIYSRIEKRGNVRTFFYATIAVLCLIMIPIQFRVDYWPHKELPAFFASGYESFVSYGHVFLGIAMVLCIRSIYSNLFKIISRTQKHTILNWSDKYSYDIYLVHHVFVQSAFGCVEFISNRWIAIPLAIVFTLFSSVILNIISNKVRNSCIAVFRKLPN